MVKLDRYFGSCNTLNDLSNKACVPNKTEDLSLSILIIIIGINESKRLGHHISCKCKCKFGRTKCMSNGGITINVYVIVKNTYAKKIMFEILVHVVVKMDNI